jgi:hypothetical protein
VLGLLILELTTLMLSIGAGAAWIHLDVYVSSERTPVMSLPMGYMLELNHALYYTICVPLSLFLAQWYFQAVTRGAWSLCEAGDLDFKEPLRATERAIPADTIERIGKSNLKLFAWSSAVGLSIVGFAILYRVTDEGKTFNPHSFGYVQSVFANEWEKDPATKLAILSKNRELLDTLVKRNPQVETALNEARDGRLNQLDSMIHLKVGLGGSKTDTQKACYLAFILLNLATQMFFVAYATWWGIKVFTILVCSFRAVLRGLGTLASNGLAAITPNFRDGNRRFGLGVFDDLWTYSLWYAFFVSLHFVLHHATNMTKGSEFFFNQSVKYLFDMTMFLLALSVIPLFILVVYGVVLTQYLEKAKSRLLEDERLSAEDRALIQSQKLFVFNAKLKRAAAAVCALFALMPPGTLLLAYISYALFNAVLKSYSLSSATIVIDHGSVALFALLRVP